MRYPKLRSIKREVNISRLSSVTKNGEVIVVPGKVLGSGEMDHQLTVCAFSISDMAGKEDHRRRRQSYKS